MQEHCFDSNRNILLPPLSLLLLRTYTNNKVFFKIKWLKDVPCCYKCSLLQLRRNLWLTLLMHGEKTHGYLELRVVHKVLDSHKKHLWWILTLIEFMYYTLSCSECMSYWKLSCVVMCDWHCHGLSWTWACTSPHLLASTASNINKCS